MLLLWPLTKRSLSLELVGLHHGVEDIRRVGKVLILLDWSIQVVKVVVRNLLVPNGCLVVTARLIVENMRAGVTQILAL